MTEILFPYIPFLEGRLALISTPDSSDRPFLAGLPSKGFPRTFKGKYPLEAVQLCQQISSFSGLSHALCSVSALEDYLEAEVPPAGRDLRTIMHYLSFADSFISRFYFSILPGYLNRLHQDRLPEFAYDFYPPSDEAQPGDLSAELVQEIFQFFPEAQKTIFSLKQILGSLGGKYPGIMNLIPGGVTNLRFGQDKIQILFPKIQECIDFIHGKFTDTIIQFCKEIAKTDTPTDPSIGLISFGRGSRSSKNDLGRETGKASSGTIINDKFELFSPFKVSYIKKEFSVPDSSKPLEAHSLFYDGNPMESGALARILVGHYSGTDSDAGEILSFIDKELNIDRKNIRRRSARILAECFEVRLLLREALVLLLSLDPKEGFSQKKKFSFEKSGIGSFEIDSPCGSLSHRVSIEDHRIQKYEILPGSDWNLAFSEDFEKSGVIRSEIQQWSQIATLTPRTVARIAGTFNAGGLESSF